MNTSNAPASDAAPAHKPRKSWWDTVITSTPVVMTVVATILAGLSSGEMGRAQYYRSIAAQMQAKVSDQWSFFQAKRLRASGAANALMLPLLTGRGGASRFDPATLTREIGRLVNRLAAAEKEADRASEALAHDNAAGATTRTSATTELRDAIGRARRETVALAAEVAQLSTDPAVSNALSLAAAGELPAFEMKPIASADIREAMKAVESTSLKPESAAVLNRIKPEELEAAMRTSDDNAAAFDAAAKPVVKAVERMRALLAKFELMTIAASRAAEDFNLTLEADKPDPANRAAGIIRLTQAAASESSRLNADLSAATLRYDAARYEREATINLATARLYEIQVRKATLASERHLTRSYYFFYGMLGAQAAVTLASLALAVKERSIFWSIATTVGAAAVAYGGYVYLFK